MGGAGNRGVARFGASECRRAIGIDVLAATFQRTAKLLGVSGRFCSDEASHFTFERRLVRSARLTWGMTHHFGRKSHARSFGDLTQHMTLGGGLVRNPL